MIETNNRGIVFPEVINNFNVYNDAAKIMGTTGEINIAELQAITATVSGAGILGEYTTSVVGMFQSMTQEIPFRMIDKEFFGMLNTGEQSKITLRSSIQQRNRETGGTLSTQAMRIVIQGHPTSAKMGRRKAERPTGRDSRDRMPRTESRRPAEGKRPRRKRSSS